MSKMADKDWHHASTLLKRIRDSQYPSEKVVLVAGKDDQKFPIHTLVLTASSKYFASSLNPNLWDGQKAEIVSIDTDGKMLEAIIDHCYSGHIAFTLQNVGAFLAIASNLEFDLLEKDCRKFLEDNLTVANCVDTLIFADKYGYAGLRQETVKEICDSFGAVPAAEIQKLDFHLMAGILRSDSIKTSEDSTFNQLLEWVRHDKANRSKNMAELLGLIRLEFISKPFFNEAFEAVYKEFGCFDLILAEYRRRISAQLEQPGEKRSRSSLFHCISQRKELEANVLKIEKWDTENDSDEGIGNRFGCGLVVLRNKAYVMGGRNSSQNTYFKTVFSIDLKTGARENLPEMHSARSYFGTIAHGKYIYAIGGFDRVQLTSCERFDTETKIWEPFRGMDKGRSVSAVISLDKSLCVAGGYIKNKPTAMVELYNPEENKWARLASMNRTRVRCALFKWNGTLYVIGGDPSIEKYDQRSNRWIEIGSFQDSARITNVMSIGRKLVAVKDNGGVGWVTIGENDVISFTPICRLKYIADEWERHLLYVPEE